MEDTSYSYERDDFYCYPNSSVLKNKLGIISSESFKGLERSISALKIAQIDQGGFDFELTFDAAHLRAIHRFIFSDIFEWAGEYRNVNISKGTMFCAFQYIRENLDDLFSKLKKEDFLSGMQEDQTASRLAYYLGEINAVHAFREGNGRAQRVFIRQLAYECGYVLSFAHVSGDEMIRASIESFNGNNARLEMIVGSGLTRADEA